MGGSEISLVEAKLDDEGVVEGDVFRDSASNTSINSRVVLSMFSTGLVDKGSDSSNFEMSISSVTFGGPWSMRLSWEISERFVLESR